MTDSNCKVCVNNITSLVNNREKSTQKKILKQNKTMSSLYTNVVSSLNNTINNNNEGIKHNSYNRYLNKKKFNTFKKTGTKESLNPKQGNKTKSFLITELIKKCNNC